jgi:protein-tyrosine sulfotransferase
MTDPRFGLVLGFPRSGGTLLRRILDQHPDVSCPPEPWLTTAAARFLADTPSEGIALGVRTGVGFSGIAEAEVTAALRALIHGFHARMAGGKPVWVEKSGFDVFHLTELTDLFAGHAKMICMLRHPLDAIASNLDLSHQMGRFPAEMQPYLARFPAPVEALAQAWADTTEALLTFAGGREDAVIYRFEDLLSDPETTMSRIFGLLGVAPMTLDQINAAVAAPSRPGLGDWKTYGEPKLNPAPVGRWQKAISRRTAGALMARLGPVMIRAGYDPVPVPRVPSRAEAIKQFGAAARLAARSVESKS